MKTLSKQDLHSIAFNALMDLKSISEEQAKRYIDSNEWPEAKEHIAFAENAEQNLNRIMGE